VEGSELCNTLCYSFIYKKKYLYRLIGIIKLDNCNINELDDGCKKEDRYQRFYHMKELKIFAFFGSDLDGFTNEYLTSLIDDNYIFLALDSRAIELVSQINVQYTIISDWFNDSELIEVKNIAFECEINWYSPLKESFSSNGICWPEIDHAAMSNFWLDGILSLKFTDIFLEKKITSLMIVSQNEREHVVYYWRGSICKYIWESKLGSIIKKIKPKGAEKNRIEKKENKISKYYPLLFSPNTIIKDKNVIIASDIEFGRINDLLCDINHMNPNDNVIIPFKVYEENIPKYLLKWKIPIISPIQKKPINHEIRIRFLESYSALTSLSIGKKWEYLLKNLDFHFKYYCEYRWPMLDCLYSNYHELFLHNKPRLVIGTFLNITEWYIPILAAKALKIPTYSIPHAIDSTYKKNGMYFELIRYFDFHLYLHPFIEKSFSSSSYLFKDQFIPCKNCTDLNSHVLIDTDPKFGSSKIRILVLFSPTSFYIYPDMKSRLIFPVKNAKTQIYNINLFNDLAKKFSNKLSIRFKVHPGFSELELFSASASETYEKLLPINSNLLSILDETDLVIGINYSGSALIHVLNHKKPYINFINDGLFKESIFKTDSLLNFLNPYILTLSTRREIFSFIETVISDPSILKQMENKLYSFYTEFLDNSSFLSIGEIIKNKTEEISFQSSTEEIEHTSNLNDSIVRFYNNNGTIYQNSSPNLNNNIEKDLSDNYLEIRTALAELIEKNHCLENDLFKKDEQITYLHEQLRSSSIQKIFYTIKNLKMFSYFQLRK